MDGYRIWFTNGQSEYYPWPDDTFLKHYTREQLIASGIQSIDRYSRQTGCWIRHRTPVNQSALV